MTVEKRNVQEWIKFTNFSPSHLHLVKKKSITVTYHSVIYCNPTLSDSYYLVDLGQNRQIVQKTQKVPLEVKQTNKSSRAWVFIIEAMTLVTVAKTLGGKRTLPIIVDKCWTWIVTSKFANITQLSTFKHISQVWGGYLLPLPRPQQSPLESSMPLIIL